MFESYSSLHSLRGSLFASYPSPRKIKQDTQYPYLPSFSVKSAICILYMVRSTSSNASFSSLTFFFLWPFLFFFFFGELLMTDFRISGDFDELYTAHFFIHCCYTAMCPDLSNGMVYSRHGVLGLVRVSIKLFIHLIWAVSIKYTSVIRG